MQQYADLCDRFGLTEEEAAAVRVVPLTRGYVTIVDAEDYEEVSRYKWCAAKRPPTVTPYAVRTLRNAGHKTNVALHRVLLDITDPRIQVDHINGNGLDNRRINLRLATASENQWNRRRRAVNASGFKGVTLERRWGRWRARIRVHKRERSLGHYDTPEAAARAYDEAARRLHGEYAALNFPQEGERAAVR